MKNSTATLAKRNVLRQQWRETIDPNSFPHEIERTCKRCKQRRMCRWMSSFTQTGKPEYRTLCPDCHNLYLSERRKAQISGKCCALTVECQGLRSPESAVR